MIEWVPDCMGVCMQVGLPTWLQLQRVTADGMAAVGAPRLLIRNDAMWEGPVIEAPYLVLREVSKGARFPDIR